jgi:hypothetical protein
MTYLEAGHLLDIILVTEVAIGVLIGLIIFAFKTYL